MNKVFRSKVLFLSFITLFAIALVGLSGANQYALADSGGAEPPIQDTIPEDFNNSTTDSLFTVQSPQTTSNYSLLGELYWLYFQIL